MSFKSNSYSSGTFVASFLGSATLIQLQGSATRKILVRRVALRGTDGEFQYRIQRHSTLAIGGASVADAMVRHNPFNPAATATVLRFTAPPADGVLIGILAAGYFKNADAFTFLHEWGPDSEQLVTLDGPTDCLTIFQASGAAGITLGYQIDWEEVR